MKQKEKTVITKNKILNAALAEFGENGYGAGTVNNICKTGINKGLIYHNFIDKDQLYLECVKISCQNLIQYIKENHAADSFADYMNARMAFFREHEAEAHIFMEARTNPQNSLIDRLQEIFIPFDELNSEICRKELSRHKLREGVTKEEALSYFSMMQAFYNSSFIHSLAKHRPVNDQIVLHEETVHKLVDFMLYGIVEREERK